MKGKLHTKLLTGIAFALSVAVIAPVASAKQSPQATTIPQALANLQQPGGTSDLALFENVRGGPGGVYSIGGHSGRVAIPAWLSKLRQPGGASDLALFENVRGGPGGVYGVVASGKPVAIPGSLSRLRQPGGASDLDAINIRQPGGVSDVGIRYPQPTSAPTGNGFDWADAAVGAGFMAGIALLALAGALAFRRRRPLAHA